jgi:hypothetical protein
MQNTAESKHTVFAVFFWRGTLGMPPNDRFWAIPKAPNQLLGMDCDLLPEPIAENSSVPRLNPQFQLKNKTHGFPISLGKGRGVESNPHVITGK